VPIGPSFCRASGLGSGGRPGERRRAHPIPGSTGTGSWRRARHAGSGKGLSSCRLLAVRCSLFAVAGDVLTVRLSGTMPAAVCRPEAPGFNSLAPVNIRAAFSREGGSETRGSVKVGPIEDLGVGPPCDLHGSAAPARARSRLPVELPVGVGSNRNPRVSPFGSAATPTISPATLMSSACARTTLVGATIPFRSWRPPAAVHSTARATLSVDTSPTAVDPDTASSSLAGKPGRDPTLRQPSGGWIVRRKSAETSNCQ
jgi:hypothetical protein